MKILSFTFKNVFSFGDGKVHTIQLDPNGKMWEISGDNGSGKSNLRQMMVVSVYGKCPGVNNSDIPNKTTPKGNYTSVDVVDDDGTVWNIRRGFSPTKVSVYRNGSSIPEDKGGVGDTNEFIIRHIVKIPYRLYNDIFMLSVDEIKSLTKLGAEDTRRVFDASFDLTTYNDVGKLAAKDRNLLISQIENYSHIYRSELETLESLDKSMPMYESMLKLRDRNSVRSDIGEFNHKIIELSMRNEELSTTSNDLMGVILSHKQFIANKQRSEYKNLISAVDVEIDDISTQMKSYDDAASMKSYVNLMNSISEKKKDAMDMVKLMGEIESSIELAKSDLDREKNKEDILNKRADEYKFWKEAYSYTKRLGDAVGLLSAAEERLMEVTVELSELNRNHNECRLNLHKINGVVKAQDDGICNSCGSEFNLSDEEKDKNILTQGQLSAASSKLMRDIKTLNSESSMLNTRISRLKHDVESIKSEYKYKSYTDYSVEPVINGDIGEVEISERYSSMVNDDTDLQSSNVPHYESVLEQLQSKYNKLDSEMSFVGRSLDVMENSLGSEIYDGFRQHTVQDIERLYGEKNNRLMELNSVKIELERKKAGYTRDMYGIKDNRMPPIEYDGDIDLIISRKFNVDEEITSIHTEVKEIETKIAVLNEELKSAIDKKQVDKDYRDAIRKHAAATLSVESAEEHINYMKRRVYILDRINAICMSPVGIKSYFADGIVPFINSSVADILGRVRPDLSIVYDKSFNNTIEINGMQGTNPSSGQKKIMDIAIFVTLVRYINAHFASNVVFYDESLDSISQHSKVSLLAEIKNVLCDMLKINVFVTDQLHVENSDIFDSSIHMQFDGFSKMTIS